MRLRGRGRLAACRVPPRWARWSLRSLRWLGPLWSARQVVPMLATAVAALSALSAGTAHAQVVAAPRLPAREIAPKPAAHDAALKRLEAVVRSQLGRRKTRTLGFEEAVLAPQASRLVWGPGTIQASRGRSWRVAVDARTRWYYVLQVGTDASERWFGPLDEAKPGVFEQVGAAKP